MNQIEQEINERILKLKIVKLRKRGLSRSKVALKLGITIKKVRYWEKKYDLKGTIESTKPTGRKSIKTQEISDIIETETKNNRTLSCERLSNLLKESHDIEMSGTSVWRIREALKFKYKAPKVKPKLTEQSKIKDSILLNTIWKNKQIGKKVVFTDETWFYLESLNGFIWRQWGENDDSVYREKEKYGKKIMFFGGINSNWMSTLIKCPKIVNSESYQNNIISRCRVFSDMDKEYGQWNWLLMQDGAPAHTSNSTKEYLSNKCLVLKNWPPNSPDLNPIENLWGIMGRRISKESPNSERKLELIVRKVWKNIEWEVIENLINSMEKRLRLVVELNGESINGYF
ncbi:transposable element-related [Anaeramoeba flamelloides]|uniref:Transposable element-related n=1 Tax=Anaeramoeba flamelloides TaxID=1746091 RepID=A0ABQ8ZBK8_9EUKA|nr:transposable element-related [Anaeramoeba flamelloides]